VEVERSGLVSRRTHLLPARLTRSVVKLTFASGAALADPSGLFNASLEGKVRRAIDIREGDDLDEAAFKTLIRAAAALNARRRGS
jgi:hypothetical protein